MLATSCTSGKKSLRNEKGTYLETVRLNFQAGEDAMKSKDYEKAISYFQFVRSKYPNSQYAALSDLRIADAKYLQKKYVDAASAYEVFIRLHPRHEQVEYASYRMCLSYFYAMPEDFFLFPKSTTRDQSFTKEALAAIDRFILQFKESSHVKELKEKRAVLYDKLSEHSMFIAAYYEKRGRHEAAIERYLSVDDQFPESSKAAESLYLAAMILKAQGEVDRAIEIYTRIINEKPSSPFAEKARQRLLEFHVAPESNSAD
jgi:outer membrane protein assembly factor BamD